jgi:hypothetical protein
VHSAPILTTTPCAHTVVCGSTPLSTTKMTSGEGEPPSVRTLTHTVQIRSPSQMSPSHLQAEVRRCTREDGTIGLVSVCHPCHQQAERLYRLSTSTKPSSRPPVVRRTVARNRSLDIAAKMERAECQCDQRCHRRVTADNVGMFEWDHLVQSSDDADYHSVSAMVHTGYSTARYQKEIAKCRLLHAICHRQHSNEQRRQRTRMRAERRKRMRSRLAELHERMRSRLPELPGDNIYSH